MERLTGTGRRERWTLSLNFTVIFFIVLTCLVSGLIQGLTGFGMGIAAMAVMPLFLPMREAVPLVALLTTIACLVTVGNYWRRVDWREFTPLFLALACGVPIGVWGLDSLPGSLVKRFLGASLLVACAQGILLKTSRTLPRWSAGFFGFASGILSGALNVGGPPMLLYLRGRQICAPALIATLHLLFIFSGIFRSGWLLVSGLVTWPIVTWLLTALPLTVAGIFLGGRIREGISEKAMNRVILASIALLGTYYLVQG